MRSLKRHSCYSFETVRQALLAAEIYRQQLKVIAQSYNDSGEVISDANYPTELFALRPKQTAMPPLVLIGGMGALAGMAGFELACKMFHSQREIILLQACGLPNRTTAMALVRQAARISLLGRKLVSMLAEAIETGVSQVQSQDTPIQVIVLCNAAHYFLPLAWRDVRANNPKLASRLEAISLIESTVEYLLQSQSNQPLLLCTSATRWGGLYSNLLENKNLTLLEPNDSQQLILMDCIYKGVKALDQDFACRMGERLFLDLLETQFGADCIIAGCSEIPCLLRWLKAESNEVVQQFLLSTEIIDPVELALKAANSLEPISAEVLRH